MAPFPETSHYATVDTVSPGASAFTVGLAGVAGFLAMFLAAVGLWRLARLRTKAAQKAELEAEDRKLAPGYAILHGKVETGDDLPAVSVRIHQKGREYRVKNGMRHQWTEFERQVDARPFHLRLGSGEKVKVVPGPDVLLIDILGSSSASRQPAAGSAGQERVQTSELKDRDPAYVCGTLVPPSSAVAYRTMEEGYELRPAARGRMLISAEPLEDRYATRARLHARWVLGCLAAILFVNGILFRSYWLELFWGRPLVARVTEARTWTTSGKHGPIRHYGVNATVTLDGDVLGLSTETNRPFYDEALASQKSGRGLEVPFLMVPSHRATYEIGASPTIDVVTVLFGWLTLALVSGSYLWHAMHTRPWYERKKVVHKGSGPLGLPDDLA